MADTKGKCYTTVVSLFILRPPQHLKSKTKENCRTWKQVRISYLEAGLAKAALSRSSAMLKPGRKSGAPQFNPQRFRNLHKYLSRRRGVLCRVVSHACCLGVCGRYDQ